MGPHTGALSHKSAAWYERVVLMMTAGLAAFSALTVIGIAIALLIHYKKKARAAAAAAVAAALNH